MRRIRQFWKGTYYIFSNGENFTNRLRLFINYAKVSFLLFAENRFIKTPEYVKFLSFKVYFRSLSEFFMLTHEVFAQHPYAFKAKNQHPIIVDCGGNIGMSILYFKYLYPQSEIYVFEPDPDSFEILKRNVKANKLESVHLHDIALGDMDGTVQFYSREGMSLASTVVHIDGKREDVKTVKIKRLSEFLPNEVDLLKIDVQMSEGAIIKNLKESRCLQQVKNILMEYHYLPKHTGNSLGSILDAFDANDILYKISLNTMLDDGFATYTIRAGELSHVNKN